MIKRVPVLPKIRFRFLIAALLCSMAAAQSQGVQSAQEPTFAPLDVQLLEDRNPGGPVSDERARRQAIATSFAPFLHGVASGDPLPDGVILWTRVTPESPSPEPIAVRWRMALTASMSPVLAEGSLLADAPRDYTVKVDVGGLLPNQHYYYQFEALGRKSVIGRTRTGTTGNLDRLRLAAVSCSDYRAGYFHAYAALAARNDVALILHLGDYFYEGGGGPDDRTHEPDAEIYRLQDYRARYSQYRLDPDLQRVHQVHPFSTIWDDHDIVVDALRDTSLRHDEEFGSYRDRKWAAIKAAYEWLPLREDPVDSLRIWRSLPYGDLAEVFLLDTRLYDRDRFASDASDPIYQSPDHRLIGPAQMAWLQSGLAASTGQWKVLANQVMMGHLSALEDDPIIFENWAGYTAERDALYNYLDDNNITNTVVVTGDFHVSMALDLAPNPRLPENYNPETGEGSLAVEFLVPSVTGENFDEGETYGFGSSASASFLISQANKHIKWSELDGHGYVLLDLNADRAQAEFWHMEDISNPDHTIENAVLLWESLNGTQRIQRSFTPSPPIEGMPPLPPLDTTALAPGNGNLLLSAGPNPFESSFSANLLLRAEASVQWSVYNAAGQRVAHAPAQTLASGNYLIRQTADTWTPGLYILDLGIDSERVQRKLWKGR
ncbi:MAG: phosphodiesterase [Bacteroidetes bacterium]|nr:phosphodiesterase [Bacteroidota bacterium]